MGVLDAVVTATGQVTIPEEIRSLVGLVPGVRVEFQVLRDGTVVMCPLNASIEDLFAAFSYDGPARSLDDIEDAIAEAASGAGEAGTIVTR